MKRITRSLVLLAAWCFLLGGMWTAELHAQGETITIQGTVTNGRGAALPGATIIPLEQQRAADLASNWPATRALAAR